MIKSYILMSGFQIGQKLRHFNKLLIEGLGLFFTKLEEGQREELVFFLKPL